MQTYESHVGFLLAELDLIKTFLEMAQTTADPTSAGRYYADAKKGYDTVLHFYGRMGTYREVDQLAIDTRLDRVSGNMERIGAQLESGT